MLIAKDANGSGGSAVVIASRGDYFVKKINDSKLR
jgi:hypothetical protein